MVEPFVENLTEGAAPGVQQYFAHSTSDDSKADWQLLSLHLTAVGAIAGASATWFGGQTMAEIAGLLHDVGKYTDEFQRRIAGHSVRVDHATRGAMLAVERYGPVGWLLAYGIAGHHAGLANGVESGERTTVSAPQTPFFPGSLRRDQMLSLEIPGQEGLEVFDSGRGR